ncbi:hypothetical protein C1T30_43290, partial [Bacillus sp. MBGLi97]
NNQTKYETLLTDLKLTKKIGTQKLNIYSNSQIVTSQITESYQTKNPTMKKYLNKTKELLGQIGKYKICHIPREQNARTDTLSKLT